MLGSRTVGHGPRRLALVLAVLLAGLAVLPAAAAAQDDEPPIISDAFISPTTLPFTGGTVTVTALIYDDVGLDTVWAEAGGDFGGRQVAMTSNGSGDWSGTFDVPENTQSFASPFYVQVYARDTNGSRTDAFGGEGVIEAPPVLNDAPVASSPAVTPASLPYTGGLVTLEVTATDADGVSDAYALVSTGAGTPVTRVQLAAVGADRFRGTFAAPANTSNADRTHFVNFVAVDPLQQEGSVEGPTFTVAGRPTGSIEIRAGDRDFGKVKRGRSATRSIVLRNLGGKRTYAVTGVLTTSGPPFSVVGQTATGLPFTLKPGESKTFTIRFAPTALGVATGKVNVVRSDGKQVGLAATVTGRGI